MLHLNGETATDDNLSVRDNTETGNMAALAEDKTILRVGGQSIQHGLRKVKLKRAIEYINEHLGEDIRTLDVAVYLGMSQYHFSRLFKQSMGVTVHAYLVEQRVQKAMQLLRETELSILTISDRCGFANPSHLARCFRRLTGTSPKQYRLMG